MTSSKQKTKILDKHNPENAKSHVALIMGGMSREREVSLSSGEGVYKALKNLGYKVTVIDMGYDLAEVLDKVLPDVVFNALHGTYGEDGCLPGLLNIMQIPYTHSGVLASAIAFNKERTREVMQSHDIKMAEGFVLHKNDKAEFAAGLKEPMMRPFVAKPIAEGSSVGVTIYFPGDNYSFAEYDWLGNEKIVVERYIPGREVQVAIVGDKAIGAIEIVPKGRFYDYQAKYTEGFAMHLMPAPLSPEAEEKLLRQAEKVHKLIGCKTLSRIDFRYDDTKSSDGEFYLLEANTHPGFTPLSLVPEIAAYYGITYEELVDRLIREASWEQ